MAYSMGWQTAKTLLRNKRRAGIICTPDWPSFQFTIASFWDIAETCKSCGSLCYVVEKCSGDRPERNRLERNRPERTSTVLGWVKRLYLPEVQRGGARGVVARIYEDGTDVGIFLEPLAFHASDGLWLLAVVLRPTPTRRHWSAVRGTHPKQL